MGRGISPGCVHVDGCPMQGQQVEKPLLLTGCEEGGLAFSCCPFLFLRKLYTSCFVAYWKTAGGELAELRRHDGQAELSPSQG